LNSFITLDYTNVLDFIDKNEIEEQEETIKETVELLESGRGAGSEFLGWYNPEAIISSEELQRIKDTSKYIRENFDTFLILGIGGSYLGERAVISALSNSFANETENYKPKIYYAGFNLDSGYIGELFNLIKNRNIAINVISKSGTTTETALSFRIFYNYLKNNYNDVRHRIYVTTDKEKGALKNISDIEKFQTFVIPDNIGGRFSVLTPVGLFPIATAGINIDKLLQGATDQYKRLKENVYFKNPALMYAVLRYLLYKKGKIIEILANFNYKLNYISQWWKQLFGESEGKNGKGIFPVSANFTTDLHSLGQFIQEGTKNLFETFLNIENPKEVIKIPKIDINADKFNFLANNDIEFVNKKAYEGTKLAHKEGGVPNMTINIPELNEYCIGQLLYFFEKSVSISGYLLNVNPFNQPGVESYKNNMFALLGKRGYESENKKLNKIIKNTKKHII